MAFFIDLERFAGSVALVEENGNEITYGSLLQEADALAAQCGRRCLVFMMCSNTAASVIGYVGFLRAGIVPVLINNAIDAELLQQLLDTYLPEYLYFPEGRLPEGSGEALCSGRGYVLAKTPYGSSEELYGELGLLLTTSGSTGSPKLVRQSYKNIESNTASIIEYLGIVPQDRAITTLPMHYTYGLSIITTHLAAGASLILTEKTLMDKEFWRQFKEYGATTFGGVPYIYEMLKKLRFERMNLPSLRYITQAGGKLSAALVEEFARSCEEKNVEMIVMYGQTEATARMAWLPWKYAVSKAASIGFAIPGGRFWVMDADGGEVQTPETVGELVYDGPNVTLGYAEKRSDLAKGDEWNGRLVTGDMAKFDEDGFFYIVGRKKRFLKLFGSRVNLDEVENLLNAQGITCACGGKDDRLAVFIVNEAQRAQAEHYLAERLSLSRAGFAVSVIESIPRSEAGKVLYSALPVE